MGEVALVLKSVTVLVSSLKEARKTSSATSELLVACYHTVHCHST